MRLRSYLWMILALGLVVGAGALASANRELAGLPVRVGPDVDLPLEVVALAIFLLGLLPPLVALGLAGSSRRLEDRRRRRAEARARGRREALDRIRDLVADGRWTLAAREIDTVDPADAEVELLAGEIDRRRDRPADALAHDRRAVELAAERAAPRYAAMEDHRLLGDHVAAGRVREEIRADLEGFGLRILRELQDEALEEGDLERAEALGAEIEASGEEVDDLRAAGLEWTRAADEASRGEVKAARKRLRRLVERRPDHVAAWRSLGELDAEDSPSRALETWKSGFEATGSPSLLERISRLRDRESEAADVLGELRRMAPSPETFDRWEARIEIRRKGTIDSDHGDPYLAVERGRAALGREDREAALGHWRRALDLAGLGEERWSCAVCSVSRTSWRVRCAHCGAWDAIEPMPATSREAR